MAAPVIELLLRAGNREAGLEDGELLESNQPFSQLGQQQQFEIIDSRGEIIPWVQPDFDSETSRLTLTVTSLPQNTQPKVLRYY